MPDLVTRRGLVLSGTAALVVSGCATPEQSRPDASPEAVARHAYTHDGPPELILYTMINNRTGSGAHTSLLVNASQRVVFDPAGSVSLEVMPEIGDVLYGITPQVKDWYERAHARSTYHVLIQSKRVPFDTAEQALRLVQANGRVAPAQCTAATASILAKLEGFETIRPVLFPTRLAAQFGALPGVESRKLFEDDADDKAIAEAAFEARLQVGQ